MGMPIGLVISFFHAHVAFIAKPLATHRLLAPRYNASRDRYDYGFLDMVATLACTGETKVVIVPYTRMRAVGDDDGGGFGCVVAGAPSNGVVV